MNDVDYFTYNSKIDFIKSEIELLVTKQDEVIETVKRVLAELEELSRFKPVVTEDRKEKNYYKEQGNPDSHTVLEKVGDGG